MLTNSPDLLQPPRRNKVVKNILKNGFSVNIIKGFGKERDQELAKCKTILNIHGQMGNEISTIFEHIRCNRLLDAGYSILSETSQDLDPEFIKNYPNLQFKSYSELMKI